MAGLTTTTANAVLNVLTRNSSSFAQPAALYAALFSVAPTDNTTGTEFTTAVAQGYNRCAVTFGPAANGQSVNTVDVHFPNSAGAPVDVVGASSPWPAPAAIGVFDSISGGNLWYYQPLTGTQPTIGDGYHMTFQAGSITLRLD